MTEDDLKKFMDENREAIQLEIKNKMIARLVETQRWEIQGSMAKVVNEFVKSKSCRKWSSTRRLRKAPSSPPSSLRRPALATSSPRSSRNARPRLSPPSGTSSRSLLRCSRRDGSRVMHTTRYMIIEDGLPIDNGF